MAGTAFSASVLPGSPAFSPTENCTVRPSALMKFAVARYTWYSTGGTLLPGGWTGGSALAGPSWLCSAA